VTTTGYTATIYAAARCEDDCRMDIYHLDEVWSTPEQVLDRLVEERETIFERFERFECREYYSRLEDEPEECDQSFNNMIQGLREAVVNWNAKQAKLVKQGKGKVVYTPVDIDEQFEDVSVCIKAVKVYL